MQLEIRLFATLKKFHPQLDGVKLEEGATVRDFIEKAEIPLSEVAIIMINGRHVELDHRLCDGETLALFPAIAGG
jgi:molybdopterin converting factor small subunit